MFQRGEFTWKVGDPPTTNDPLAAVKKEQQCYLDGTYTLPHVKDYDPFGVRGEPFVFVCNGCLVTKPLTKWISHNVHRTPQNPDYNGSFGDYAQISYYCNECYPEMEKLARAIQIDK